MIAPLVFDSEAGSRLLSAIAARHGERFAALARLPSRAFVLFSGVAPGLRCVGAEVAPPVGLPAGPQSFSLGGTGETVEDALTSCLGEGVERLSQVERRDDVALRASPATTADRLMPGASALIGQVLAGRPPGSAEPEIEADWIGGSDLATGRAVLVPADWCLRRPVPGPLTLPNTALSTGVAAGPTPAAAAARALLELVERDAAALWWIGGRRGRPLSLDDPAIAEAAGLLGRLRQGARARLSWLLDLTTDLEIPSVAAISVSPAGGGLACGLAARLSVAQASKAAILEMCQMELAIDVVDLKRAQRGEAGLNEADRRRVALTAAISADTCDLLHPRGAPRVNAPPEPQPGEAGLRLIQNQFAAAGVDVALVALTRPEYGIPVMAAIAPALQRFPSDVPVPRLQTTIAATGGGARWTSGLALL